MSDTPPDTGTEPTDPSPPDPAAGSDLAAEVEKWKAAARKHEDRAKANSAAAKELETLRQQSMSETEKAVNAAREEGRTEARRESAMERVEDAVRAAAAGRPVDVDALLEGLDKSRFVTDDGEPDRKAIVAWVDRVAPQQEEQHTTLDLGQGARPRSQMPLNGDPIERDLREKLGIN